MLLIFYLLEFNSIWVSTDSDEIVAEAKKFNVNVHLRAAYTATDDAPSLLAIQEFIQKHPGLNSLYLLNRKLNFMTVKF